MQCAVHSALCHTFARCTISQLPPCRPRPRHPQLVPSLDPEMAWQNAEKIAAEMLALVKGCAPHIQHQWAWAGVCNLLKMTAIR